MAPPATILSPIVFAEGSSEQPTKIILNTEEARPDSSFEENYSVDEFNDREDPPPTQTGQYVIMAQNEENHSSTNHDDSHQLPENSAVTTAVDRLNSDYQEQTSGMLNVKTPDRK